MIPLLLLSLALAQAPDPEAVDSEPLGTLADAEPGLTLTPVPNPLPTADALPAAGCTTPGHGDVEEAAQAIVFVLGLLYAVGRRWVPAAARLVPDDLVIAGLLGEVAALKAAQKVQATATAEARAEVAALRDVYVRYLDRAGANDEQTNAVITRLTALLERAESTQEVA